MIVIPMIINVDNNNYKLAEGMWLIAIVLDFIWRQLHYAIKL